MGRALLPILASNAPDGARRAHDILGHGARYTLRRRGDSPLLPVGHQPVGILLATRRDQLLDRVGLARLAPHRPQMPLPLAPEQRVGPSTGEAPNARPGLIAPLGASRGRGGWYGPGRPWVGSTVMEPPRSGLPRTVL